MNGKLYHYCTAETKGVSWANVSASDAGFDLDDAVGLKLDLTKGTLTGSKNGTELGTLAQGLEGGSYCWAVELWFGGDQIQIVTADAAKKLAVASKKKAERLAKEAKKKQAEQEALFKQAAEAFDKGDKVIWTQSDSDIPAGTVGKVDGLDAQRPGSVYTVFPKGRWSFPVKKLQLAKETALYKTAEAAFDEGDRVTWTEHSADIPAGTIGNVQGASEQHLGKVVVVFAAPGQPEPRMWAIPPDQLEISHG